ncbi:MAG: pantetheine-phosphate adenylyltransferase [Fibrobacter sp.]|nr:pantetheine-phosphate adenylyltransferase [Fibrobacter sp.]
MVLNSKTQKKTVVEDGRGAKSCERRVAVFAGSFDPFTVGHMDIVRRASSIFDELWVLLAVNASKKYLFDVATRVEMVRTAVAAIPNVKVDCFDGLTVNFMKTVEARYLVRGIRNASDLDAEQAVAWNNKAIYGGSGEIETVLLLSAQEHLVVSSTLVRELLKCGTAKSAPEQKTLLSKFVPKNMVSMLLKEFRKIYETV